MSQDGVTEARDAVQLLRASLSFAFAEHHPIDTTEHSADDAFDDWIALGTLMHVRVALKYLVIAMRIGLEAVDFTLDLDAFTRVVRRSAEVLGLHPEDQIILALDILGTGVDMTGDPSAGWRIEITSEPSFYMLWMVNFVACWTTLQASTAIGEPPEEVLDRVIELLQAELDELEPRPHATVESVKETVARLRGALEEHVEPGWLKHGATIWTWCEPGESEIDEGQFVGSAPGRCEARDLHTGSLEWSFEYNGINTLSLRLDGAQAFLGYRALVPGEESAVECRDRATGGVRWRVDLGSLFMHSSGFHVSNGCVVLGARTYDDTAPELICLDSSSGVELWRQPTARIAGVAASQGQVIAFIVEDDEVRVVAIGVCDARHHWSRRFDHRLVTLLGNGHHLILGLDHQDIDVDLDDSVCTVLSLLDTRTGETLWEHEGYSIPAPAFGLHVQSSGQEDLVVQGATAIERISPDGTRALLPFGYSLAGTLSEETALLVGHHIITWQEGRLTSFDALSLEPKWSCSFPSAPVDLVSHASSFAVIAPGHAAIIDAALGTLLWETELPQTELESIVAFQPPTLAIRGLGGFVAALHLPPHVTPSGDDSAMRLSRAMRGELGSTAKVLNQAHPEMDHRDRAAG